MGKESRESKQLQEVGKYNVKITLIFMHPEGNMLQESINCKTWLHNGNFLVLQLFDGTMRVVCLERYHSYTVSTLTDKDMEN